MNDKRLHLIGITGHAQCGKDTAADYLCKISNAAYWKDSFANPIKGMLGVGLGLDREQLHGYLKDVVDPRFGKTPRQLMQTLGTEWGRELVHPNIWVYAMKSYLEGGVDMIDGRTRYIIPDVRFENEANFIRKFGVLIHITGRDNNIKESDHVSEAGVLFQEGDIEIRNDGSLNEFLMRVCDAYHVIVNRG